MIYSDFCGKKLSLLGFGAMRLPLCESGEIDEEQLGLMVDYAQKSGVNYYDTAYPYHAGKSETALGRALSRHPRDSFFLATKYPGHQIMSSHDPAAVFEDQLKKCGVDYFDFYLLHNVCESSVSTYTDTRWGIVDYFVEQRRLGRIKHLGFSTHARPGLLRELVDGCMSEMEFCQIQLNYLDWTLQDAKEKYELLKERNIPVWVMEPVRGGRLCAPGPAQEKALSAACPGKSPAEWCFRFLQGHDGVKMILSGMSNLAQLKENIDTFTQRMPLDAADTALLLDTAETMKDGVPCTACRYCCDGCPMGLDIPMLMSAYNELRFSLSMNVGMLMDSFPDDKRPSACIGCGKCTAACPQNIDIPAGMKEFDELLKKAPNWTRICREREEAQKALKKTE